MNEKTTVLRRLAYADIVPGDLLPIVDSSSKTGPVGEVYTTGETKHVTLSDLAAFIFGSQLVNFTSSYKGLQTSNGLSFDETILGSSNNNRCYGSIPALGSNFSLFVKGFVASDMVNHPANDRVLFGVGNSNTPAPSNGNSAYIAINGYNLLANVGGTTVTYPGFFSLTPARTFYAGLTKSGAGVVTLYLNGVPWPVSQSGAPASISNNMVVMGNGVSGGSNIKCTIYEAHVFNVALNSTQVADLFYGGTGDLPGLIASYDSENLNPGPTQWLDDVGSNHLLLPVTGAMATCPSKRFLLNFLFSNSGYLGDGSSRSVLPSEYILTSCVLDTPGKPLLSIGSNSAVAPVSASGTGSWRDNRVSFVSASYGVNPLTLIPTGMAHADRTVYVAFSGSATTCAVTFDGYIRDSYNLT